ncbi:uncharacterized protein LOC135366853 isoform X2 [Ornithodoros turicata]|uniref:uncharacterized protein LOC135366853 isoform X2 n=1 Tax=Ornithodoros turicata TaxID=34597 RepID=UPI0031389A89
MYYASFFPPPMRQLDGMAALVGRGERGEIPLDLSLKRGDADAAEELLLLEHRKLAAAAYAAGRPLLDPATYLRLQQQYQQRVAADAFLQQAAAQHHALAAAARLGCLDQHVAGVYPSPRTPFLEPALAVSMRGAGAPALAPGDLARSFYPPTAATAFPAGLPQGYSSMFADLLPKPEHRLADENGLVSSKSSYLSTRSPVNGEKPYDPARYTAEQLAQAKYAPTTSSSSSSSHSRDHKRSSSTKHSESTSRHSESSSRHPAASTAHSDPSPALSSPSLNLLGPRPSLGGGLSSAFGETLKRDDYLPAHLSFCPPWGLPPLVPPVSAASSGSLLTPSPQKKKEPKSERESPRKSHHSNSHSSRHAVPPSKREANPTADENGDIIVIDEELLSLSSHKTSSAGGGRPPPPPEPQRARMPRLEAMQPPDEAKTSHLDIKRHSKSPLSPPPLIAAVPPATSPKTGEAASIAAILKESPPHKSSRPKSHHDEKPTLNFYHTKIGVTTTAPSTLPTATTTTDASYLHQHRHYLNHHQLHHHPLVKPIVNSDVLPPGLSESSKILGDGDRKPAERSPDVRYTKAVSDKTTVAARRAEDQRKEERKATTVRIQKENGGVRYSIHPKKRMVEDDSSSSSGSSNRSSPSALPKSAESGPVTKKAKRHIRHQFLARATSASRCVADGDLQSLKPEFRQKRLFYHAVRRRRLRSGLDMIHRYKKVKSGRYKVVRRAPRKPFKEVNYGTPPDLKKFLVNKALGETVLHRAARLGYTDLVLYCLESGEGGHVDARDNAGYTPLHESCSRGHLNIARALLQYGADANASSAGGVRPLHDAVENNHVEVVRLLLSYGADATISTYAGLNALKLARSAVMVELLRGFLSDMSGESVDGKPVLPWHFSGTASLMDPCATGYDVLSGAPDEDDGDDFLFEISDAPHIPTFRLPLEASTQALYNCMRLSDVLLRVRMTAEDFKQRYPEIEILSFPSHEVDSRISPWTSDMTRPGVSSDSYVDVIRLDEPVRQLLGIETVALR